MKTNTIFDEENTEIVVYEPGSGGVVLGRYCTYKDAFQQLGTYSAAKVLEACGRKGTTFSRHLNKHVACRLQKRQQHALA